MKIGLYVHIPFCHSKCHYCDFLSFSNTHLEEDYTKALVKEIMHYGKTIKNKHTIQSIFIGGGTPTVLSPFLLDLICDAICKYFDIEEGAEWTVEGNPGTIHKENLKVLRNYPVNRMSLGLQTTKEHLLKSIGRIHTFKEWEKSIYLLQEGGISTINTDLMFALPGQTLEDWKESLQIVTSYNLSHLSAYALILEEGTCFYHLYEQGKLQLATEEIDRAMYTYAKEYLESKGYHQYELSNWSKPGMECKQNVLYWEQGSYIGVGLGSHSYMENIRFHNETNLKKYIELALEDKSVVVEKEIITEKMAMEEFMFLGLRMTEGISITRFYTLFKKDIFSIYNSQIEEWIKAKVLVKNNDRIHLTAYGLDIANQVFMSFLLG